LVSGDYYNLLTYNLQEVGNLDEKRKGEGGEIEDYLSACRRKHE
jgi:hypothetical protein